MTVRDRNLTQAVTHWVATPGNLGALTFAAPVALLGHWEQKSVLFRSVEGVEETSEAVVTLNADVAVQDYIFDGTSVNADPIAVVGARQVRQFFKTPDLRNLSHERVAFL